MRVFSSLLADAGAGTLTPQVAIAPREPPGQAWFSLPNILIDATTGHFVWVDMERNIAALPGGFVVPVFSFGLFRDVVRRSREQGFSPDAFHMMDMDAFKAFLTRHPTLLTEEERGHIDAWIENYRRLSAAFTERSPWMWRDGFSLRRWLSTMRANNIYLWQWVSRERTAEQAVTLRASRTAYLAYWAWRTAIRLPEFAVRVVMSLIHGIVRFLARAGRFLWAAVRLTFNSFRFIVDKDFRQHATEQFFHSDIREAFGRRLISREMRDALTGLYTQFDRLPVYVFLWVWQLAIKPLSWLITFFGIGQLILTGRGWWIVIVSPNLP